MKEDIECRKCKIKKTPDNFSNRCKTCKACRYMMQKEKVGKKRGNFSVRVVPLTPTQAASLGER